jgi:hypothetical protein
MYPSSLLFRRHGNRRHIRLLVGTNSHMNEGNFLFSITSRKQCGLPSIGAIPLCSLVEVATADHGLIMISAGAFQTHPSF